MKSSHSWEIMAASRVIDKDKGWKRLKKTLKSFSDELVVGIPGKIDFNVPTQGAIGAVHEFGSVDGTIPSRSFLRSTFDKNVGRYNRSLAKHIRRSIERGAPRKQALFMLGERIRKDVLKRIRNGEIVQDISDSTKKAFVPGTRTRRGDGVALVSTGTMVGSIVAIVRPRR